jgi:hypothetical protein
MTTILKLWPKEACDDLSALKLCGLLISTNFFGPQFENSSRVKSVFS